MTTTAPEAPADAGAFARTDQLLKAWGMIIANKARYSPPLAAQTKREMQRLKKRILELENQLQVAQAVANLPGASAPVIAEHYLEIAKTLGGCGDGNCVIWKPRGMHTNGGCRCVYHIDDKATHWRGRIERLLSMGQIMAKLLAPPKS